MSGFALVFNRHREPVSPETLNAILLRLAHRGPDGSHTVLAGNIGLGCQHFWVTPEDVGVQQPLADRSGRWHILFDGRLDNRAEVLSALAPYSGEDKAPSDAELILAAYLRWGDACFERLLGPMAAAIVDYAEQRVVLARDAVGSRTLFYYLDPFALVVASEPYAVLAHPAVSPAHDETSIARWYAVMAPRMGTTFFADVSELLPAHAMAVGVDTMRQWRHWDIDADKRLCYRSVDDYTEHFLHLLKESIHCRLRATTPIGVSMSGGYDSTSVAALAARELASGPARLRTFSWVFDELTDCDERPAIEVMNRHFDTVATYISSDDAWPLRDWENWPYNPNMPDGNPYRLLKERLYQAAAQSDIRVVLTGVYGDQISQGKPYWLTELLKERRVGAMLVGLCRQVCYRGLRRASTASTVLKAGSWLLDAIPGARRLRPRRQPELPSWLTPYAQDLIARTPPDTWLPSEAKTARPGHHKELLGTYTTTGGSAAIYHSNRAQIDVRNPYHDRRLIELALAMPAYVLYDGKRNKSLVYRAMDGILPDTVRAKPGRGPLGSLYKRGLVERERDTLRMILDKHDAIWKRFVRAEALSDRIERLPTAVDGTTLLIPWFCASMEMWHIKTVYS